jgi:hypothetical protein
MPAPYYTIDKGAVRLIALDTNDFDGPQKDFVQTTLKNSKAQWNIVFGHHPIYSYGSHGNTPKLVMDLLPVLCTYQNTIYMAGHDHDLQVLIVPECQLPLLISGASAKLRPTQKGPKSLWASSQNGFSRIEANAETLSIFMYDKKGSEIYRYEFAKNKDNSTTKTRYVPINDGSTVYCNANEFLNGISMDYLVEKHTKGLFCTQADSLSLGAYPGDKQQISHLAGSQYDVFCEQKNQLWVGTENSKGIDRYVTSAYCRDNLAVSSQNPTPYYIDVDELYRTTKKTDLSVKCRTEKDGISGVRFRDEFDRRILGIYCKNTGL